MISFSGFGGSYYDSGTYLEEGEWATGTITIREDMNFGTAFIMPKDATLKTIHVMFVSGDTMHPYQTIRPFVCIAVSNADMLVYTILQNTLTYTSFYESGVDYGRGSIKKGMLTNLNVELVEGTLVGIMAGIMSDVNDGGIMYRFSIYGGLYLE